MTVRTQLFYWLGAFVALCTLLYVFNDVLLPFVAGFALAYFLDPFADWLEEKKLSRGVSATIVMITAFIVGLAFFMLLVPLFYDQVVRLIAQAPDLLARLQAQIQQMMEGPLGDLLPRGEDGQKSLPDWLGKVFAYSGDVLGGILAGSLVIINVISLMLVTPIVAFYLLLDWDRMVAQINAWLPRDHAQTIRQIARDIDNVLAGFLRGQMSVCAVLAMFYAICLTVVGLDYGIIVGISAGGLSFIPFVGAIVGLLLSVGLAIGQFWPDFFQIGLVAVIFFVGQALEGNFLSPKLVGDHVKLHPVWIMFALLAFGSGFGFVGMLVAVPVAAIIGVLTRHGLSAYLESALFGGVGGAGSVPHNVDDPSLGPLLTPASDDDDDTEDRT